jgi:hypothetical protein
VPNGYRSALVLEANQAGCLIDFEWMQAGNSAPFVEAFFVELNNAHSRKKGSEGARVALKFEETWIY